MSASFYGPVRKISLELRLKRIIISFKLQDTTLSHKLQAFGHRQITYYINSFHDIPNIMIFFLNFPNCSSVELESIFDDEILELKI